MRIAVVYLARSDDGSSKGFVPFAESYRKFSAGIDHDLIIIRKGEAVREGSRRAIELLFDKSDFFSVDRTDVGFDIHAYVDTARLLDHDYICFFNTYSVICADDWLLKLVEPHLKYNSCGVTGATASYESLPTSVEVASYAIWLTSGRVIPYQKRLADHFSDEISQFATEWFNSAGQSDAGVRVDLRTPELWSRFQNYWRDVTSMSGPLKNHRLYDAFPNPHVRSNGFVVNRKLFCDMNFKIGSSKIDCCQFESGVGGLPAKLAERGLQQILVGADGSYYTEERWPESGGFRLGDQKNVLVRDNQVAAYDDATPLRREHLARITWGDYVAPPNALLSEVGFEFKKRPMALTHRVVPAPNRFDKPIKISIVIPSHDRPELVRQALHTILEQDYKDWECVIFDNCSKNPLYAELADIVDARIKIFRSDTFLPVTDSWNAAIDRATGDYVTLIGDDDGLSPTFLSAISFIAHYHQYPDFIYSSFFQFFHPGVAPWEPSGYVIELRSADFFRGETDIFQLPPVSARAAVRGSMELRRNFAFNMQSFCFERGFLETLKKDGKVFHSPFPDYYLANVAFGLGKKITIAPKALSVAGVSRRSFGFTLFNKQEKEGSEMLATDLKLDDFYNQVYSKVLPGPIYNTNYIVTMMHVESRLGAVNPCPPDVERYRQLQILNQVLPDAESMETAPVSKEFDSQLTADELKWARHLRCLVAQSVHDPESLAKLREIRGDMQMSAPDSYKVFPIDVGSYATLPQLYSAMLEGIVTARLRE